VRYYLDTNVLIFALLRKRHDELSRDVQHILSDYSNQFYVSSVVVQELIHAYKTGDIQDTLYKSVNDLFDTMEKSNIEIVPMNRYHLI